MYFSAKKYPEFQGKDKTFMRECVAFSIKDTWHSKLFWIVVLILLVPTMAWLILGRIDSGWGLLPLITTPLLFYCYLIYNINNSIHTAVKNNIQAYTHIKLQQTIESLCQFDYESIDSIKSEIFEKLGYEPKEIELHSAIISLVAKGLIIPYVFKENKYIKLSDLSEININNIWFIAIK